MRTAHKPPRPGAAKQPFDLTEVVRRLRKAVRPLPKAALFQLAEEGYTSVFEQLVACIISIRTYDETTVVAARRLFAVARSRGATTKLTPSEIDRLIGDCTFHRPKAENVHAIAVRAVEEFGGKVPCEPDVLLSFRGVGPKCANLVLGIACGKPAIGVDIHVHRVTNRWGYVSAPTPEKRSPSSNSVCRSGCGWRSIRCWCRLGSTSARACGQSVRRARCSTCADRSA
jgi:endonuclease-3